MSHRTGRFVARGNRIGPDSGSAPTAPQTWHFDMPVDPAQAGGPPYYVILHFTAATLPPGAKLEVDLGYDKDRFDSSSGADLWTRPVDPNRFGQKIPVTFTGTAGGVTLAEYGSGEPLDSVEYNYPPGGALGSHSQPDCFLHNSPYIEPIYETRLKCHDPFGWSNAAAVPGAVERAVSAATGIIVGTETAKDFNGVVQRYISSCSGTLVEPDLFLTARHCAADGEDVVSASVCFDFETDAAGARPAGYNPRWYKVVEVVASGAAPNQETIETDWLILRLDPGSLAAPNPAKLGRATPLQPGENVIAVSHPGGAVKKLQHGKLDTAAVQLVSNFDYAGGSSGSALFDAAGNVIGAALSRGPLPGPCQAGYSPASNVNQALANPPIQGAPWDVMLVIDRSGSMAMDGGHGQTKLQEARDAASLFVQLIRASGADMVGLDSFSSSAGLDQGPVQMDPGGKAILVGNPPAYSGGRVGAIQAGGDTSIGDGLRVAMSAFPAPHDGSRRAILLLTDGLQNTQPLIADVEDKLGNTRLFVVGYGSDADLDGPLLTRLARDHGGLFLRAGYGLALRKYFGLTFGGVFQAGALADPEHDLPAGQLEGVTIKCPVFDETEITAIVGWDNPLGGLKLRLTSPDGTDIDATSSEVAADAGRSWAFVRVPLPYGGAREGIWRVTVLRDLEGHRKGAELPLRYFVSVIADGGPALTPLVPPEQIDVGDPLLVRLGLHYPDRSAPLADVEVTVTGPRESITELVDSFGRLPATTGPDPLSEWSATLHEIAAQNGGTLPIATFEQTFTLRDDATDPDGALERDGVFATVLDGLTNYEGTYDFHAVATYGDGLGRREAWWSITVGMDDGRYGIDGEGYGEGIPPWVKRHRDR